MERRSFFTALTALTATALADPEALLWTPDQRTIFIPKVVPVSELPYMMTETISKAECVRRYPNSLLTTDMITRKSLKILEDTMKLAAMLERDHDFYVGDTWNVRKPERLDNLLMVEGETVVIHGPANEPAIYKFA